MKQRYLDLMRDAEGHPLAAAIARAFTAADAAANRMAAVKGNRDLSQEGQRKEIAARVRETARDLRDERGALDKMRGEYHALHQKTRRPAFDQADIVGFLRRQELRAAIRGMGLRERAGLLTGPDAHPEFLDAVLEVPPLLSGLAQTDTMYEHAAEARREQLYGRELAQMRDLETAIQTADAMLTVARVDVMQASGLRDHEFEALVGLIERRADAPWLKRSTRADGTEVVIRVLPENRDTAAVYREATPDEVRDGVFYANEMEWQAARDAALRVAA